MDLISIIVPVYKVEKYIHRCINSIINQTYTKLEIILVDDGSPDNCGKICDDYAQKDNRLRVIHKANGGLSDARNYGIEAAKGEWLMFVDSDDWLHPQTVEKLYIAAVESGVSLCACSYEETDEKDPEVDTDINTQVWTPKDFYLQKHITATVAWGKLYRKNCFDEIRYPVGKIHEDEYVTYRILFAQKKIAFVDQPYYAYYINSEGITKSEWSPKRLDAVKAFWEQLDFFKALGDKDLFEFKLQSLFWNFYEHKKLCNKNVYRKESRFIKNNINKLIFLNYRYFFHTPNAYMAEKVYPRFMRIYWLTRAAIKKIMRRK